MGRITSFSKQVIVFFLVTALIIRPTFAANLGGWTLGGGVAQGASTVYEGTKKVVINGVDYIKKGTAKITPPASSVAKVLARGAAGYALSVAVEQLLGAVDWVMKDGAIVYTVPKEGQSQYYYEFNDVRYSSPSAVCNAYASINGAKDVQVKILENGVTCSATRIDGGDYISYSFPRRVNNKVETEEKKLPLITVAQKVISNAESETDSDKKAGAQVATGAAAADIVAEAESDQTGVKARPIAQQLENTASTKPADSDAAAQSNTATGTQTQNPTKPETTDLALEFPAFCGWAPLVCEAAQTVISFPTTLTDWWNTGKTKAEEWAISISEAWTKVKEEYADKPTENTDTQLDLPDQSDPNINTDLSFGGSCPASRSVPVSFAGIHTEIEFSFQWFCEVASIAKPVVISISAFAAALIVAGVRTEDD